MWRIHAIIKDGDREETRTVPTLYGYTYNNADKGVYTWVSSAYKWDPSESWYDIPHHSERRSWITEYSNMSIDADTYKSVGALTFPVSMFSDMSLRTSSRAVSEEWTCL